MAEAFPSLGSTSRAFPIPSIPEDTLHYTIYPSASTTEGQLQPLSIILTYHIGSLLPRPWIWHKDAWELKAVPEDPTQPGPSTKDGQRAGKLEGRMRVGDSVDDEWLVVWLLREISRLYTDAVISVKDSDGQFLLIEGANELPSWVSPDNADNRLWIMDGHLHLIPLSVRSSSRPQVLPDNDEQLASDPAVYLSELDGLAAARTGRYRVDWKLEQAVWSRIARYPSAHKTHLHRTKAYLPVKAARALKKQPELVQRAVEAFYVRDPAQLRAAARMTHFPPSPAVLVPLLLTRPAYAQLQGQKFHSPRSFGQEWTPAPSPDDPSAEAERRWRDLGVKIATGFEIMYREGGRRTRDGQGGKGDTLEDVQGDPGFEQYIEGLRKADWFKGERKGSKRWNEKMTEAVKGWKNSQSSEKTSAQPSFAYLVDQAASQLESTPLQDLEAGPDDKEDSESWLEVSPDELDSMMARASGRQPGGADEETVQLDPEDGQALQDMAKKVEDFVGGQGDLGGARFEDELSDDDISDEDEDMDEETEDKEARLRGLVEPLAEAEWGQKMPVDGPSTASSGAGPSKRTGLRSGSKPQSALPKMRPPVLSREEYDGVVDESSDEDEDDYDPSGMSGIRPRLDKGKGKASSAQIEELDEDGDPVRTFGLGDNIEEEMYEAVWGRDDNAPQVVDTVDADGPGALEAADVDMEAEAEEFLEFSREMLRINDEQWERILADRQSKGAYVPASSKKKSRTSSAAPAKPPPKPRASRARQPQLEQTDKGERDMSLDSFEKVMAAMEGELARSRAAPPVPVASGAGNGAAASSSSSKRKAPPALPSRDERARPIDDELDDMSDDDLVAMDRELKAALKAAGVGDDEDEDDGQELGDEQQRGEWKMMRDFLESYRAQGGGSGVVGNLFGRLGEKGEKR